MPAKPCSVCVHESRMAIEQALINGKSMRSIARDFGIGSGDPGSPEFKPDHSKVRRHARKCMGEALQAAKDAREVDFGKAIGERLNHLDEVTDEVIARQRAGERVLDTDGMPVLDPASEPDSPQYLTRHADRTLLAAVREARRTAELRAKLAGAMPEHDERELERMRAGLDNPRVRRLLAQVDELLGVDDQELPQ